ncbi:MAG: RNA methyltransferase [Bacteroidetes bacterium]|nr:RNA methyltransferase [Bacteroidota bacterium]
MFTRFNITSLEKENLLPYKTLRRVDEHIKNGIFVAEGKKLVERLLESNIKIISLLLTEEWFSQFEAQIKKRVENIDVFVAPKIILNQIVGFKLHQGIMGVGEAPQNIILHDFVKLTKRTLFAVIDGIMNSENVGVIVRNCAAFNVDALIVGETSSDPFLRRAVRNSMGTIFKIPIIYSTKLADDILFLKNEFGFNIFAAHTSIKSKSIYEINFCKNSCIVFGNEEDGPRKEILNICDCFEIPMKAGIDSLNVANASAVVLYEVDRQRLVSNFK